MQATVDGGGLMINNQSVQKIGGIGRVQEDDAEAEGDNEQQLAGAEGYGQ